MRTSKTVSGCFSVLFQFYFRDVRTPEIKQNFVSFQPTPAALFNCSFISDVRTSLKQNTETVLGLFQPHIYSRRVEKYANEAATISV